MLQKEDVKFKEPEDGDFVLFFRFNPRTRHYQTDVGIIVRELDESSFIVSSEIRQKEQILFVLTLIGYEKQKLLSKSPTVTTSVRQILQDGKGQT